MFGRLRTRLAGLLAPLAAIAPPATPLGDPLCFAVPRPAPKAANAALRARSAAFGASCRSHVAVLDQALAGLIATGGPRPDQQDYARDHRLRFAEAVFAVETLLSPQPDWPACQVLEIGSSITPMLFHAAFPAPRLPADALRNLAVVGRKPCDPAGRA